jgi:cation transport ATPase
VRRAELSRWEAYGLGILVFGISCVFVAREILPLVRPRVLQWLFVLFLPFAMWLAFLLLYYCTALAIAPFRRWGFYAAATNNPFQHVVIMSLTTLLATLLLRDECYWLKSLGVFWLALLGLNILSVFVEKLRDET